MLKDLIQARLEVMRAKKALRKDIKVVEDNLKEIDDKIAQELLAKGQGMYVGYTLNSAFEAYFEGADEKAVEEIAAFFKEDKESPPF